MASPSRSPTHNTQNPRTVRRIPVFVYFIPYNPVQLHSRSARSQWRQHNVPTATSLIPAADMAGIYHISEFYRQPTTDEQRPTFYARYPLHCNNRLGFHLDAALQHTPGYTHTIMQTYDSAPMYNVIMSLNFGEARKGSASRKRED